MKYYEPLTNTTEDILAARRAMSFEIHWYAIFPHLVCAATSSASYYHSYSAKGGEIEIEY
jgi:hypothetical protein